MEGSRPTLAIVTSSVDQGRWQNPAKAVGHVAEHDLGYHSLEFDVDRDEYRLRPDRDPLMAIETSSATNSLAAIITVPWEDDDDIPREVATIRNTAQRYDIPTFIIGSISGESMTDLGENTYLARANSITLFESLRDLGLAVPSPAVQESNVAQAEMQHMQTLGNSDELSNTLLLVRDTSVEFKTRFGFAIDSELLANDWKRGARHFQAVHNVENILDIAANARTKRLAKQGVLYKAPPRDIMFGFWWNTVEGYQRPIVQLSTYGHQDVAVRKTAQYILEEKHAVPLDFDLKPIDPNYTQVRRPLR